MATQCHFHEIVARGAALTATVAFARIAELERMLGKHPVKTADALLSELMPAAFLEFFA